MYDLIFPRNDVPMMMMEKRLRQKDRRRRDLSRKTLFLSKIGESLFKKTPMGADSYLFWETSWDGVARVAR